MTCVHRTVPVQVWADVDEGIADLVKYLNTVPGVRTHASCQGTIGEGGAEPYGPQVMVSYQTEEAETRLRREFDCKEVAASTVYVRSRGQFFPVAAPSAQPPQPDSDETTFNEIDTKLEQILVRSTGKTFQQIADDLNQGKTVAEFYRDINTHAEGIAGDILEHEYRHEHGLLAPGECEKNHCVGTFWTEQEIAVIDKLSKKQELSHVAVLRQSLRNYQLLVEGVPQLPDKAQECEFCYDILPSHKSNCRLAESAVGMEQVSDKRLAEINDALIALRSVWCLFSDGSPFYVAKVGGMITNGDQSRIDHAFIAVEKALTALESLRRSGAQPRKGDCIDCHIDEPCSKHDVTGPATVPAQPEPQLSDKINNMLDELEMAFFRLHSDAYSENEKYGRTERHQGARKKIADFLAGEHNGQGWVAVEEIESLLTNRNIDDPLFTVSDEGDVIFTEEGRKQLYAVCNMQEWIEVEDRLPKSNAAIYFIVRETGERHIGKMFDLSDCFWSHECQKFYSPQEVSHWILRALPAPPEGQGAEKK